jgi:two-component system chemotaxis response regulator CheB
LTVIIVHHRGATSDGTLASILDNMCSLSVKEAEGQELLEPGTVYLAPANYHLRVEKDKTLALTVDETVNYSRPSIDVLFESAANVFGQGLTGVILTAANEDGSQGLKIIKEAGGITVVQDPATAEVSAMPQAAVDCVEVDHLLPLEKIGPFLVDVAKRGSVD